MRKTITERQVCGIGSYKHWGVFILLLWSVAGWSYSADTLINDYGITIDHDSKTVKLPDGATVSDSFDPPKILIRNNSTHEYRHLSALSRDGVFSIKVDDEFYTIANPIITPPAQDTPPAYTSPPVAPSQAGLLPLPAPEQGLMHLYGQIASLVQTNQQLYGENIHLHQNSVALQAFRDQLFAQLHTLNQMFAHAHNTAIQQQRRIEGLTQQLEYPPLPPRPEPSERERQLQERLTEQSAQMAKAREQHRLALQQERDEREGLIAAERNRLTTQHQEDIEKLESEVERLSEHNPDETKALQRNLNRERQNVRTLRRQLNEAERQLQSAIDRAQHLEDQVLNDASQYHDSEQSLNRRIAEMERRNRRLQERLARAEAAHATLAHQSVTSVSSQDNTEPLQPAASQKEPEPSTTSPEKSTSSKQSASPAEATNTPQSTTSEEDDLALLQPVTMPSEEELKRKAFEEKRDELLKILQQAISRLKVNQQRSRQQVQIRLHRETALDDYWQQIQDLESDTYSKKETLPHAQAYSKILLDQLNRLREKRSYESGVSAEGIAKIYQRLFQLIVAYPQLFTEISILDTLQDPFSLNLNDTDPFLASLQLAISSEWGSFGAVLWNYLGTNISTEMNPTVLASHLELLNLALLAEDYILISNVVQRLPGEETFSTLIASTFFDASPATENQPLARRLYRLAIQLERILLPMLPRIAKGQLWNTYSFQNVQTIILRLQSLLVIMQDQYDDFSAADLNSADGDTTTQLLVLLPDVLDKDSNHWKKHIQNLERRQNALAMVARSRQQEEPAPDLQLLRALDLFMRELNEPQPDVSAVTLLDPSRRFASMGLTPKFTLGDGHCFFHAITHGMNTQQSAQDFIQALIQFAQQQSQYTTVFSQINEQQSDASSDLNQIVSQLLNAQSLTSPGQQQNWGGQEILSLVSYFLEQPILIIEANHHFSSNGHIAILFQPGSEPQFLNFLEAQMQVVSSPQNLIILGFLQGDPNHGYGNHWFPLIQDQQTATAEHTENATTDSAAPFSNSTAMPDHSHPEAFHTSEYILTHQLKQFLYRNN